MKSISLDTTKHLISLNEILKQNSIGHFSTGYEFYTNQKISDIQKIGKFKADHIYLYRNCERDKTSVL